jgi:hypothetical protein
MNRKHPAESLAIVIAVALIGGLVIAGLVREGRDCASKDGRLVRGMLWVECVQVAP